MTINERNGYASFDLETAKVTPIGDNPHAYRPLGIITAAIATDTQDLETAMFWAGMNYDNGYTEKMTKDEAQRVVMELRRLHDAGWPGLTWNGFHFDYVILAEESGMWGECFELALDHYDMMFQFFCRTGFFIGLHTVEMAHGLAGKYDNLSGADIPPLWKDREYERVLLYQRSDVIQPLTLAGKIHDNDDTMLWFTKQQRAERFARPPKPKETWLGPLLTVKECFSLPEPDTGWIRNPTPRSHFLSQWERSGMVDVTPFLG